MITPQQKHKILVDNGYDPAKNWIDDDGNVIDSPQDGSTMAGIKAAAYNIPSTVMGVAGAGLGALGAGLVTSPSGPGAVAGAITGSVAGGAGGGWIGDKIEEALYPKSWQLGQEARQVRNPTASTVGEVGSSLALMRPSVGVTKDALAGLRSLTSGAGTFGMRPAQSAAFNNIVIGGGLGAGTDMARGGDVQSVLTSALLGAAQHQPTRLGARLPGITRHVRDTPLDSAVNPADLNAPPPQAPAEPAGISPEATAANEALLRRFVLDKQAAKLREDIARRTENDLAEARRLGVMEGMANRGPTGEVMPEGTMPPAFDQVNNMPPRARVVENLVESAESGEQFTIRGEQPFADQSGAPMHGAFEPTGTFERGVPTQSGFAADGSRIPRDLRTVDQRVAGTRPFDDTPDQRPAQNLRPPQEAPSVERPPVIPAESSPGHLDATRNLKPSSNWNKWWADNASENFRSLMRFGTPRNESGAQVAGRTDVKRVGNNARNIDVATDAYTDTAPHELTHALILDVLDHGNYGEQRKMRSLLQAANVPEEQFVQGVGEDVVKRFLDKTTDSWRDDFGSFMRYKMGRASAQDARRIMSNVMLRGGGSSKIVDKFNARPPARPEQGEERTDDPVPSAPDGSTPLEATMPEQPAQADTIVPEAVPAAKPPERKALPIAEEKAPPVKKEEAPVRVGDPDPYFYPDVEPFSAGKKLAKPAAAERKLLGHEPLNRSEPDRGGDLQRAREELAQVKRERDDLLRQSEEAAEPAAAGQVGSSRRGENRSKFKELKRVMRLIEQGHLKDLELDDVGRPENVTYSGESIPARTRISKANKAAEAESPADLENRRIEAKLAGEERPRYQEFGPNRSDKTYGDLPEAPSRISTSVFESATQAAARSSNPTVRYIGDKLSELFPAQRAMQGKYRTLPDTFEKLNTKDRDVLYRLMVDEDLNSVSGAATVPARLRGAYNDVRATLKQMRVDQLAANHPREDGSMPKMDPFYFPNVIDPSVRKTLNSEIDSPRYKALRDEFIDYNTRSLMRSRKLTKTVAEGEATQLFERYVTDIGRTAVDDKFNFGSVGLPSGSKLPGHWMHSDVVAAMNQYVRSWSKSRTFFDTIRSDDRAMAALGQSEYFTNGKSTPVTFKDVPVAGDDNIKFLLNEASGVGAQKQDTVTRSVGRLASTLWLANPITRMVDVATSPFKALGYVKPTQIAGLIGNLRNLNSSISRAHDTGWVKSGGNTVVGEVLGAGESFTNWLDKTSRTITKYTGSEKLEHLGRGLAQNSGEYIFRVNNALALAGDVKSTAFLDRVASNWRKLPEAEMGTRIGQLFQGKYDATNLPKWLSDSPAAPFFSLSRWNIEQWNNFREFAIKPARTGNYAPLITMIVSGMIGGVAVKEIRESMSGRKSRIANIDEMLAAPEGSAKYQEGVRYLGNLTQLTGTGGIMMEIGNMALQVAAKDKPQTPTMPAYELGSDTIPRAIAAARAIAEGQDPLTVVSAFANDLADGQVSFARFVKGVGGRTGLLEGAGEDLKDANLRRDQRVSKRLRGKDIREAPDMPIDYSKAEERDMERTRKKPEMMEKASELKSKIRKMPNSDDRTKAFASAAASRISYMPSKDNDPKEFRDHMKFVEATQGKDSVKALRERYLRDQVLAERRRAYFKQ